MKYTVFTTALDQKHSDCLILGFFENRTLAPSTKKIDQLLDGLISKLLSRNKCTGKAGETVLLNYVPAGPAERIVLVGLGRKSHVSPKDYIKAIGSAIKSLKGSGAAEIAIAFNEIEVAGQSVAWKARQIGETIERECYQFNELKSEGAEKVQLSEIALFVNKKNELGEVQSGIRTGLAIAGGSKLCKDLANLPGNVCTPTYLAERAAELSHKHPAISTKILEEEDMEKLGMGALLSVSKGSRQPAKLIILEYRNGPVDLKPIVLVGKGLTFDAGGISIKPAPQMDEMKYDMCGGASVIGTLAVAAELELPLNVIGIVPSSENLPDGNANKPGDIVTSMSGKTIEILNTDAEGRLILCDALTYAGRYDPELIIDVATLTGACIIALGHHPSGLMGTDDDLCEALIRAGETAEDRVWRLPLWEDYQEQLKSNFADMANVGNRDAGTIIGACFLSRFTEKVRWAHLDIAGTAWVSGKAKGATGRPVPLLSQFLIDRVET
ncbi:MAG: leucyl aminopeptidase [Methylococcaceae bacterium]|nr:leucyl aminopeptidase [Methylococcaceae bacterium]MCI0667597.1 leucyl aminopeptidase [Methylococcaceae bacterium]